MSPLSRLFTYVRRKPALFIAGGVTTVGYAIAFPLIPLAIREVIARIETGAGSAQVTSAAWTLIGLGFVVACLRFGSRYSLFRGARQVEYDLRGDLCSHLQRLPQSYFASNRTGDLMSRAVNDVNSFRMFLGMGLMNLCQTPVLYLTTISAMLYLDWRVTLAILAPYVLFVPIARIFGRRLHAANLGVQEQLGTTSAVVQENASGVLVVRSYAMEDAERDRFGLANEELYQRQVHLARIDTGMQPIISLLPTFSQIVLVFVGGWAVIGGRMMISDFFAFYFFIVQLVFPTFMIGFVIALTQRGLVALQRLGEVFDTVPSIRDRQDVVAMDAIEGQVEVRGLTITYPDREREPALVDVSFRAEPGQTIGIVGGVGSGKSTLVSAIPQILEVPRGRVFIDGVDVMQVPLHLLRRSIAMVPQDSFLFSTTIAENIAFGVPDATPDDVRQAANRADIIEEIEDLPFGFETVVGERGITLSGGQRQRIALARALILEPSILILDDALSSVDAATEELILKHLRGARFGRTCFIVAHRISAVRDAHQILVLDQGRLVEVGTHAELVAEGGVYAALARRQQLETELGVEFPQEEAV